MSLDGLVLLLSRDRPCHHHQLQWQDLQRGGGADIIINNIRSGGTRHSHNYICCLQQIVSIYTALGFGVRPGSSLQLPPSSEYASQSVSWHDREGNEANCCHIDEEGQVLVPGIAAHYGF